MALGQQALKSAGKNYRVPFSPHSVGMYHSDHVGSTGLPPREDIVLEPGMILSIDCPLIETGVGGSAHLEDLMLITADGAEPINDIGQQTITV
jgi:Xaa-Pro aminopeptidase